MGTQSYRSRRFPVIQTGPEFSRTRIRLASAAALSLSIGIGNMNGLELEYEFANTFLLCHTLQQLDTGENA